MSPDERIASLAYDIAEDNFKHRKINLGYVLDQMLDEPFVSNDEAAMLLYGDAETKADLECCKRHEAVDIVLRWLTNETEGLEYASTHLRDAEDEREPVKEVA